MNTISREQLRNLLLERLTSDEFDDLCFYHFPEVHAQFTDGTTRSTRVRKLIEYCDTRRNQRNLLLEKIYVVNPELKPSASPDSNPPEPSFPEMVLLDPPTHPQPSHASLSLPRQYWLMGVSAIAVLLLVVSVVSAMFNGDTLIPSEQNATVQTLVATYTPTSLATSTPTATPTATPIPTPLPDAAACGDIPEPVNASVVPATCVYQGTTIVARFTGFTAGEAVSVAVTTPNGQVGTQQTIVGDSGGVKITYETAVLAPGLWQVEVGGAGESAASIAFFVVVVSQ